MKTDSDRPLFNLVIELKPPRVQHEQRDSR